MKIHRFRLTCIEGDKHIATVDADGVALVAMQGLSQKLDVLKTELKRRDAENAELKQRLDMLEQIIHYSGPPKGTHQ
jgi:cell division protein FtsB